MSIDFNSLFNNPKKFCNSNFAAKIDFIKDIKNDLFILNLKNNNIEYRGITIIKSDIFPTPKEDNIINIDKVQYKYDEILSSDYI